MDLLNVQDLISDDDNILRNMTDAVDVVDYALKMNNELSRMNTSSKPNESIHDLKAQKTIFSSNDERKSQKSLKLNESYNVTDK